MTLTMTIVVVVMMIVLLPIHGMGWGLGSLASNWHAFWALFAAQESKRGPSIRWTIVMPLPHSFKHSLLLSISALEVASVLHVMQVLCCKP